MASAAPLRRPPPRAAALAVLALRTAFLRAADRLVPPEAAVYFQATGFGRTRVLGVVVDLTQVTSFPLLGALFLAECCDLAAVGGAGVRVVGASAEARQVLRECRLDDLVADAGPRPA